MSLARLSLLDQPTCVGLRYGTIYILTIAGRNEVFLGNWSVSNNILISQNTLHRSLIKQVNGFAYSRLSYCLNSVYEAWILQLRIPLTIHISCSRILTTYPSGYATFKRGTPLGPTHPPLTYIAEETLGFRRHRFSLCSRYSYRHSHSYPLHQALRLDFTANKTLPYQTCTLHKNN